MQRDLESLAESATVLTETDQSFSEIADRLEQVRVTGRDRNQPEAELQFQVQQLLQQIQNRLTVPETDVVETYDRSAFVDFGWEMPMVIGHRELVARSRRNDESHRYDSSLFT